MMVGGRAEVEVRCCLRLSDENVLEVGWLGILTVSDRCADERTAGPVSDMGLLCAGDDGSENRTLESKVQRTKRSALAICSVWNVSCSPPNLSVQRL